jgi:hypothetical protein
MMVRAKYTKAELERAEALEKAFARENIATKEKLAALDAAHRAEARAAAADQALTKVRPHTYTAHTTVWVYVSAAPHHTVFSPGCRHRCTALRHRSSDAWGDARDESGGRDGATTFAGGGTCGQGGGTSSQGGALCSPGYPAHVAVQPQPRSA